MKIGLVGRGFIGEAFYQHMTQFYDIDVWDTDASKRTIDSMEKLVNNCTMIFVSVPTPMRPDGSCDTSIVSSVVRDIDGLAKEPKLVVIRSTVPPGTSERIYRTSSNVSVVFNPEFLTELNYIEDFKNQTRIVLGGHIADTNFVADVYRRSFSETDIITTDWKTAELTKYVTNVFLSVKVAFANEIKKIADHENIDYDELIDIAVRDIRLGTSHWRVPGPDGKCGFGGTCFPKDINALISHARTNNIETPLISAAWKRNVEIDRLERDWEHMKGRAVQNIDI